MEFPDGALSQSPKTVKKVCNQSAVMEEKMAKCSICKEEVEETTTVKVRGRNKKVCEECLEIMEEERAISEESEAVVQNMMGFKGRR